MKKILLSTMCAGLVLGASAQFRTQQSILLNSNQPAIGKKLVEVDKPFQNVEKLQKLHQNVAKKKTRASGQRYYSFPADMDTFFIEEGKNPIFKGDNLESRNMWQDSSVLVNYTNGLFAAEVMSLYQVLDPYARRWNSAAFNGEMAMGSNYTVDTFGMICSYTRVATKPNVIDTLRFAFFKGSQMAALSYGPTTALGQIYSDTVEFAGIKATYPAKNGLSNAAAEPNLIIKDVILNAASENDTLSSGWNYFQVPVGLAVNNDIVGVTVTFLSGDPNIVPGDSIIRYNRMRYATFSEGSGSGASFVSSNMFREDNDYNMSGNTWTTLPFGVSGGAADRFYFPAIAYSSNTPADIIGWQYHWFVWSLSTTNGTPVSVSNTQNTFREVKLYPNPTSDQLNLDMNFYENIKNASLQITNHLGQVVKKINLGSVAANSTSKNVISVNDLPSGFYIYTINADGKTLSNKFMIK